MFLCEIVLGQNSRNVPFPEKTNLVSEIKDAVNPVLEKLTRTLSLEPLELNLDRIREEVEKISIRPQDKFLTVKVVKHVKKLLGEFVLSPLDKNIGKTVIVCPVKAHEILVDAFFKDTDHYEIFPRECEEKILSDWENSYENNNWKSIAPFRKSGSLPYGYALLKDKDLSRIRPIVSHVHHNCAFVFCVCQRALSFVLSVICITNYSLTSTQELVSRLQEMQAALSTSYGKDTILLDWAADIKEMFPSTPHSCIRKTILCMLDRALQKTRSHFVRVPKDRALSVSFGKSANLFETYQISFAQIYEVVDFYLKNAFFTVGDQLLKEKDGAPMGGGMSNILCVSVASICEDEWRNSIDTDVNFFEIARYTDDVYWLSACNASNPLTITAANAVIADFKERCYVKNWKLKDEVRTPTGFKVLESKAKVTGNELQVMFFNKNAENIQLYGKQKFFNVQKASSFGSRSSKLGVILSRFIAVRRTTPDVGNFLYALGLMIIELRMLRYSRKILSQACRRLSSSQPEKELWDYVRSLYIKKDSVFCLCNCTLSLY